MWDVASFEAKASFRRVLRTRADSVALVVK